MKFSYDAARPGVRSLADAFTGATRRDAKDKETKSLAEVGYLRSRMGKELAETSEINQRNDFLNNPEAFISQIAGAPTPLAKKFLEYMNSGNFGVKPANPPTGGVEVPITEAPPDILPLMDKLRQAYQTYGATRGASTSNPHQIAQAGGEYQGQDSTREVQRLLREGNRDAASDYNQGSKLGTQIKSSEGEANRQNKLEVARIAAQSRENSPTNRAQLPVGALKLQQDELENIGLSSTLEADIGALKAQIEAGGLKLGPAENLKSTAKNWLGASDENSRNFATLKASLEKMRNDSLRLNKGVQTEGDSVRAWNELFQNLNDQGVVIQRLGEIQKVNRRAANLRIMKINDVRGNYGLGPLDIEGYKNQPAVVGGGELSADEQEELLKLRKRFGK